MPCLLALPIAACQDQTACTLNTLPAIEVEVRDAGSGEPLSVTPRGVTRDGGFEDSLRVSNRTIDDPPLVLTMIGADERAGTYVVQLEAEGSLPWDTSGIRAVRDECHVRTVTFTAALDPAP